MEPIDVSSFNDFYRRRTYLSQRSRRSIRQVTFFYQLSTDFKRPFVPMIFSGGKSDSSTSKRRSENIDFQERGFFIFYLFFFHLSFTFYSKFPFFNTNTKTSPRIQKNNYSEGLLLAPEMKKQLKIDGSEIKIRRK